MMLLDTKQQSTPFIKFTLLQLIRQTLQVTYMPVLLQVEQIMHLDFPIFKRVLQNLQKQQNFSGHRIKF